MKGQDPQDEFGDDIQTEPANSKGLVAQSQRHLEAVLRTTTAAQQQTMKSLMEENERLRKENNHLKDKFYEMQESYEELISMKHQRDMEEERQKNKERRMDEALQQFKQIAPSVVNRITGKRVLPEDQTPETQQLKNVLDDLDDSQLEQISKVLKPGQAVAFMEMVKAHLDSKEGEQNGEPKQLNKGA